MVSLIGQEPAYFGKSTDEKPSDVGVNSIFIELDTGIIYFYEGDDTWTEVGSVEPSQLTMSAPAISPSISPVIRPNSGLALSVGDHEEATDNMAEEESEDK